MLPGQSREVICSSPSGQRDSLVCAAFEPTKNFRETVKKLIPGDLIEVYGAVKDKTLNLEKLEVLELADKIASTRLHYAPPAESE